LDMSEPSIYTDRAMKINLNIVTNDKTQTAFQRERENNRYDRIRATFSPAQCFLF